MMKSWLGFAVWFWMTMFFFAAMLGWCIADGLTFLAVVNGVFLVVSFVVAMVVTLDGINEKRSRR